MKELYQKYCGCSYRVTTDSRTIKGGEMFFALRGDNFDGNTFALKALESGAACSFGLQILTRLCATLPYGTGPM